MTLVMNPFELGAIGLSVVTVALVVNDGQKRNWPRSVAATARSLLDPRWRGVLRDPRVAAGPLGGRALCGRVRARSARTPAQNAHGAGRFHRVFFGARGWPLLLCSPDAAWSGSSRKTPSFWSARSGGPPTIRIGSNSRLRTPGAQDTPVRLPQRPHRELPHGAGAPDQGRLASTRRLADRRVGKNFRTTADLNRRIPWYVQLSCAWYFACSLTGRRK